MEENEWAVCTDEQLLQMQLEYYRIQCRLQKYLKIFKRFQISKNPMGLHYFTFSDVIICYLA